ncbi:hypothetical protein QO200_07215 [Flavobacterium sp. Arc3]|uniref:hypothetical protein n=1 Tax=Flavobacterium sp. Arc3 TaxID=3046686 RepID=UPI00352CBB40
MIEANTRNDVDRIYNLNTSAKVRWGFAWNENSAGLYPNGDQSIMMSQEVLVWIPHMAITLLEIELSRNYLDQQNY